MDCGAGVGVGDDAYILFLISKNWLLGFDVIGERRLLTINNLILGIISYFKNSKVTGRKTFP